MSSLEAVSKEQGFRAAAIITRKFAKTFYFASLFLPKCKRNASFSVYAICRASDESVDNSTTLDTTQRLEKIEESIHSVYRGNDQKNSLWIAFKETVKEYGIPEQYFSELVEGMRMDLEKSRYANMEELYGYCYKVASVVGLIMLKILGSRDQLARQYAVDLGIAMQLTNILRDIKEDFSRGRVYLPQDELKRFGVTETDIAKEKTDANFRELLRFKISQARQYYAFSSPGIKLLKGARTRLVVMVMSELYSGILTSIEKSDYNVFSRRAHLNNIQKIITTLKIIIRGKYL